MEKKETSRIKKISVNLLFFSIFFLFAGQVQAEYYFVGQGSSNAYASCEPCAKNKKKHKAKQRATVKKYYAVKRNASYHVANNCHKCYASKPCDRGYAVKARHHYNDYYRDSPGNFYAGDLSTGDDDASLYPGMQIN